MRYKKPVIDFIPADASHQKKEKAKAKVLRKTQWWRQKLGQGECYHCGGRFSTADLGMDHLVPIVRGGRSTKRNLVVCCKKCNSEKGYKMPIDQAFAELAIHNKI